TQLARRIALTRQVRFGSKADICGAKRHVRFTPQKRTSSRHQLGLPPVNLHALRHTHASQLIASGMDVLTISRRLGHGSPTSHSGSMATCLATVMTRR